MLLGLLLETPAPALLLPRPLASHGGEGDHDEEDEDEEGGRHDDGDQVLHVEALLHNVLEREV